jgi:hypothetical protein
MKRWTQCINAMRYYVRHLRGMYTSEAPTAAEGAGSGRRTSPPSPQVLCAGIDDSSRDIKYASASSLSTATLPATPFSSIYQSLKQQHPPPWEDAACFTPRYTALAATVQQSLAASIVPLVQKNAHMVICAYSFLVSTLGWPGPRLAACIIRAESSRVYMRAMFDSSGQQYLTHGLCWSLHNRRHSRASIRTPLPATRTPSAQAAGRQHSNQPHIRFEVAWSQ